MQRIAIWLTEYFIRKGIVPEAEREVYEYGFAITICTIASTLGLLLGQFLGGAVLIVILHLSVLRRGYHASTHLRCFLTMCAGLLAGLGFSLLPCPLWALCALAVLAVAVLLAIPLTLHPNKQVSVGKQEGADPALAPLRSWKLRRRRGPCRAAVGARLHRHRRVPSLGPLLPVRQGALQARVLNEKFNRSSIFFGILKRESTGRCWRARFARGG